ncbi:hypothetical protein P9480_09930 [Bacillus atrophaeus]|uniref:hypothetical protein n=1 Tax=Bacillus atrophaeus TaxID=1452 RepID=UPI002E2278E5|nr:hypothetical protein [Bacillus atrophaeus]
MKILWIRGEGDYDALEIEREVGVDEAFKLAAGNGGSYYLEGDAYSAMLYVKDFGPVDPKFVEFIRDNFIDYDRAKSEDFYVIEDPEC